MRWRVAVLAAALVVAAALTVFLLTRKDDWARCRAGDPEARIAGCTAIIVAGREKPEGLARAFYDRGLAYRQKRDFDRAIADYDKAVEYNPNFAWAFLNRAGANWEKGRLDLALPDYDQAIRLAPNDPRGWLGRGEARVQTRQYDQAIADLDQAVKLDPGAARGFVDRGLAYAGKAQYDRAIEDYDRALKLEPHNVAAQQNRRLAEAARQPADPATAQNRQTIQLNSQSVTAYREHRYAEAEALAKQALAIQEQAFGPGDPKIAWTLGHLGQIYRDQGRLAEAEAVLKRALAIEEQTRNPSNATTLIDLARMYQAQRRYAEAEPLLQRFVALREGAYGPEDAMVGQALAQLASLYRAQGLSEKAAPLLQRVQAIEDRTRRRQALENLSGVLFALGFFSPFAAGLFAAYSYARHRRARPDQQRRFPVPAYVAALLIAAGVAFPIGLAFGISSACSPPGASNLCGLVGFFATGPFAAGLAIFVIACLLLLVPADVRPVPAAVTPYAAFVKLWRGQYPLGRAFWGFLIVGTLAVQTGIFFSGFLFAFIGVGRVVMQLVFWAYEIIAAVGVWRSADALAAVRGGRPALTYGDSAKSVAAKSFVVLWLLANVVLRTRGFYGH